MERQPDTILGNLPVLSEDEVLTLIAGLGADYLARWRARPEGLTAKQEQAMLAQRRRHYHRLLTQNLKVADALINESLRGGYPRPKGWIITDDPGVP